MNFLHKLAYLMALSLAVGPVHAQMLSVGPGATGHGSTTLALGLGFAWRGCYLVSDCGSLSGYWNVGYTWWEAANNQDAVHTLALTPVFVYALSEQGLRPFVEFGVGLAVFSDTHMGNRDLGSSQHFESRIGVGIELSAKQRLLLRATHYSNAGLWQPNHGIESYALVYSHTF